MKKILNIRYPKKITNISLYAICQEKPSLLYILSYQLIGVSLVIFCENTKKNPANKATRANFIPINGNKLRPKTTMPIVLSVSRTDSTPNKTTLEKRTWPISQIKLRTGNVRGD